MAILGLLFLAAAVVGLVFATPRNGGPTVRNFGWTGDVVALAITVSAAIGIVLTMVGLAPV